LVEASCSYLEAARQTARFFLSQAQNGHLLPDPLFPLEDLEALKHTGGLNNDWDLTVQAISLLFTKMIPTQARTEQIEDFPTAIALWDAGPLVAFCRTHNRPLKEILSEKGKVQSSFVWKWYSGNMGDGNLIVRLFQEIYLGPSLFADIYGEPAHYHKQAGLIDRETPLIDRETLLGLKEQHTLAIATGRLAREAAYALERFFFSDLFAAVITYDDCLLEEERRVRQGESRPNLSKPNPYMLDLAASRLGESFADYYYLGDIPDDMQAAAASRYPYVGFGVVTAAFDLASSEAALIQAGAQRIIRNYRELLAL
jgi:phosphoglycolate phosphatase-like HAD superfamily hydrolase